MQSEGVIPVAIVKASSMSTNGLPSMRASLLPVVVLPTPGMPMRQMPSVWRRMSCSMDPMAPRSSSLPWKSSLERTAWATSMARPLSEGMPASSAARQIPVCVGLYTTSTTPSSRGSARSVSASRGVAGQLGYMPTGVAFTTSEASAWRALTEA